MALFHKDDDRKRHILGIAIAMAAHVERNTPQVFSKATTDKLEMAADELLDNGELSYETKEVAKRALEGIRARNPDRLWSIELIRALQAIEDAD
jgi:hypothetical protein